MFVDSTSLVNLLSGVPRGSLELVYHINSLARSANADTQNSYDMRHLKL